eukprot:7392627-Pyramimonas_sp.AAC.1
MKAALLTLEEAGAETSYRDGPDMDAQPFKQMKKILTIGRRQIITLTEPSWRRPTSITHTYCWTFPDIQALRLTEGTRG